MAWHHWIALALLAAAAWSVQIRLKQARQARAMAGWPMVRGRVVSHGIDESTTRDADGDSDTAYSPRLAYSYEIDGVARQGIRIAREEVSFASRSRAQAYLDDRPVGSPIDVFVNPADPADAILVTRASNDWWVPVMFVVLAAAVAMGFFGQ